MNPGALKDWLQRIKSTRAKTEKLLVWSGPMPGVKVSDEGAQDSDQPERAFSDGAQSLFPFEQLRKELAVILPVVRPGM